MANKTICEVLKPRWTVCVGLLERQNGYQVPTSYSWQEPYEAALLETDWTKMQERVQAAESEIHQMAGAFSRPLVEPMRKGQLSSMP